MGAVMLIHDVVRPMRPATAWCLVLHGLGDSREGWKPVASMLGLDQVGFVFAQAPLPYPPGWSWFDIRGDFSVDERQVRASRGLIDELIEHLLTTLAIPSEKLFVLGFSQGCLMTLDVGLRSPRRFAGLIGISGFMAMIEDYPAAFGAAAREQRLLLTHGLYDGLIPIAAARRYRDALRRLGLEPKWCEYAKDHGIDPEHELPDLRAWMGARLAGR
jgi:phospholipase/carboxylesterase